MVVPTLESGIMSFEHNYSKINQILPELVRILTRDAVSRRTASACVLWAALSDGLTAGRAVILLVKHCLSKDGL